MSVARRNYTRDPGTTTSVRMSVCPCVRFSVCTRQNFFRAEKCAIAFKSKFLGGIFYSARKKFLTRRYKFSDFSKFWPPSENPDFSKISDFRVGPNFSKNFGFSDFGQCFEKPRLFRILKFFSKVRIFKILKNFQKFRKFAGV